MVNTLGLPQELQPLPDFTMASSTSSAQGGRRPDALGRRGAALSRLRLHLRRAGRRAGGRARARARRHGGGSGRTTRKSSRADFRVVAPDLRGCGREPEAAGAVLARGTSSTTCAGSSSGSSSARPALVGHSFGGSIVLEYAAQHPDGVSAVVAVGAPTELPSRTARGCGRGPRRSSGRAWTPWPRRWRRTEPRRRSARSDPTSSGRTCSCSQARIRRATRRRAARSPTSTSAATWRGSRRRCCSSPETSTASRHRTLNRRNAERIPTRRRSSRSPIAATSCRGRSPEALLEAARPFLAEAARVPDVSWRSVEVAPGITRIESVLGPRPFSQYLLSDDRSLLVDTGVKETPAEVILPALDGCEPDFVLQPRRRRPLRRQRGDPRRRRRTRSSARTRRTCRGSRTRS